MFFKIGPEDNLIYSFAFIPSFFSHVCLFVDNKNSTSFHGLLLLGFLSLRIHIFRIFQHQLGFFRNLSQLHDMASEASAALPPQCHRSAKPQSRCSNLASQKLIPSWDYYRGTGLKFNHVSPIWLSGSEFGSIAYSHGLCSPLFHITIFEEFSRKCCMAIFPSSNPILIKSSHTNQSKANRISFQSKIHPLQKDWSC